MFALVHALFVPVAALTFTTQSTSGTSNLVSRDDALRLAESACWRNALQKCPATEPPLRLADPRITETRVGAGTVFKVEIDFRCGVSGVSAGAGPQSESPSRQTVHFHFSGQGSVASHGDACEPFSVQRQEGAEWKPVPIALPWQCHCGAPCRRPYYQATTFKPLSEGLNWDARGYQIWQENVQCPVGAEAASNGVLRPEPAGHYRAVFGLSTRAPGPCPGSGGYTCQYVNGRPGTIGHVKGPCDGWAAPSTCSNSERFVCVDFNLPAPGDLDVSVP
jgi:hypothetical protein